MCGYNITYEVALNGVARNLLPSRKPARSAKFTFFPVVVVVQDQVLGAAVAYYIVKPFQHAVEGRAELMRWLSSELIISLRAVIVLFTGIRST